MKNLFIIFGFSFLIWFGVALLLSQFMEFIYVAIICGILQIILVPNVTTIKYQSGDKTYLKWDFLKKSLTI